MTKEIKKGYYIKIKPSVVAKCKEFVSNDPEIKSYNDFIEKASIAYMDDYIKRRKKGLIEHAKQKKMLDD